MAIEKNCPKCHGDGHIFNGEVHEQCDVCDGEGVLNRNYSEPPMGTKYYGYYTNYGLLDRYKHSGRVRYNSE